MRAQYCRHIPIRRKDGATTGHEWTRIGRAIAENLSHYDKGLPAGPLFVAIGSESDSGGRLGLGLPGGFPCVCAATLVMAKERHHHRWLAAYFVVPEIPRGSAERRHQIPAGGLARYTSFAVDAESKLSSPRKNVIH